VWQYGITSKLMRLNAWAKAKRLSVGFGTRDVMDGGR
jgi:hypothetical protein